MWWWLAALVVAAEPALDAQAIHEAVWRGDLERLQSGTYEAADLPRLALALGRLGEAGALDRLGLLLGSAEPALRVAAADALRWTPGGRALARDRLSVEAHADVRAALVGVLGVQGEASDMELLYTTLARGGPEARAAAVAVAGAAARGVPGTQAAVPHLLACLEGSGPWLRESAASALAQLSPVRLEPASGARLVQQWRTLPSDQARASLVPWVLAQQSGAARRAWVTEVVGSSWRLSRAAALRAVSGDDLGAEQWVVLSGDDDPWVALIASAALGLGAVDASAPVRARAAAGAASAEEREALVEAALGGELAGDRSRAAAALMPAVTAAERARLGAASDPVVRELAARGAGLRDRPWLWSRVVVETAPAAQLALLEELRAVPGDDPLPDEVFAALDGWAAEAQWPVAGRAAAAIGRDARAAALPGPPELERDLAVIGLVRGAIVETTAGSFRLSLDPELAPLAVSSFAWTAERGGYDGLAIHRLVPGFIVQTGDPRGDGMGGLGWFLPVERSATPFLAGSLGMAAVDGEATAGQWFVTLSEQRQLDGVHTHFGRVTAGMDVVTRLRPSDRVLRVLIERIRSVQ